MKQAFSQPSRRWSSIGLAIALLCVALVLFDPSVSSTARTVLLVAVFAGEVVATPGTDAEAGSLVAGRVATVEVREGQRVDKGALLALVDAFRIGRARDRRIAADELRLCL